ncbi:MAG TPA: hypothetical protein VFW07_24270 [Parafilimonas sp.]|nr:hypothetical protein [Parafilimonas sp.]
MNFFDIPIINIAISVIISWALFAIFCSLAYEAFAQLKAERGRFMKNYLEQQLQDFPNGVNWATLIYNHGNVDLLSRTPGKPSSDIDPHLFAETLVNVVANAQIVQIQPGLQAPAYTNTILADFKKATQTLLPSDVMMMLTQALKSAELNSISGDAIDENVVYKKLVENLKNWYIELNQRLTLWYKKKTKKALFITGAILAFFINVDSIQLFNIYKDSPAKRQAITSFYNANAGKFQSDSVDLKILLTKLDTLQMQTNLPVGFDSSAINLAIIDRKNEQSRTHHWWFWIWKIIGVLLSGFAASFGGPFWFDVLKKAYSVKQ